jgi:ABC-type uncharacterized transport system substrate-binding protein
MPIEYLAEDQFTIKINDEVATKLGVTIPAELQSK